MSGMIEGDLTLSAPALVDVIFMTGLATVSMGPGSGPKQGGAKIGREEDRSGKTQT